MSSIFLRIYGGLLFTLVLVAVLSGMALTISHWVRLQDYRESTAQGTFGMLAWQLNRLDTALWNPQLVDWGQRLGIPLEVVASDQSDLSQRVLDKLVNGRAIVESNSDDSFRVFSRINEQVLLVSTVTDLSEQLASGSATLTRNWLQSFPASERQRVLKDIGSRLFRYPLNLLESPIHTLGSRQLSLLRTGYPLVMFNPHDRTMTLYVGMTDDHRILRIGPVELLNLYPFRLLVAIGLFMLASISIAIYVLVRGLERRLRKMEEAATHISQGNLDVRVNMDGSDSMGQLALAFNSMASHIQRLLSIQKEMIRGVSHELRTPVARLRFALEMVADADTSSEREQYIGGMDHDIEELDKLVDEILTYANLEQGTPVIHYEREDVDQIIAQVVDEHCRLQNRVTIEHVPCKALEHRRWIDVDKRYIHRAIQNLVGNACRYAESTVRVCFSVSHDSCRVDVEDDGSGIPEEQRDWVFTAFSRLDDSRTRASGGYGLGLSMVCRIMNWHNGQAMVGKSERFGGARFSLVWPRRQVR
ncbi:MAG: HAMP domain-containing protein [Endozoicomonadaceae bacterium]|nr:HAMP domain-containing protein [Endozoicomonadaceae bacterium]